MNEKFEKLAQKMIDLGTEMLNELRGLPKNEKRRRQRNITLTDEDFIKAIKPLYPHVDVDKELTKIDAWLLAHPRRAKSRRFVVGWLNRQEKPMETSLKNIPDSLRGFFK